MAGEAESVRAGQHTLSVLVGELEGLDQAERLVHGAAHGQIVHRHVTQCAITVDYEQT